MAETTLPAVASKIYIDCKKCEAERYHVVLAHTTSTSAKVECEVCKSKKTYKLPSAAKKKSTAGTGVRRVGKNSAEALAKAHQEEYQKLIDAAVDEQTYNMKLKFALNSKLKHPKFGLGVIRAVQPDKIEVVFSDEVRNLVHNRG